MTAAQPRDDEEISLFAVATVLLRERWRIVRWGFVGAAIAAASVAFRPALYTATFSFVSQGGAEAVRSSLASLAGQFGLMAPVSSPTQSPDFYVGLIKSRELLGRVVRDTFAVAETGSRVAYYDLFEYAEGPRREELAIRELARILNAGVATKTGVVQVSVTTRWPSVSLAITNAVLDGVNEFNLRTRQTQASAERKFIEGQLATRRVELRAVEDKLLTFLNANRVAGSAQLHFEQSRLERELAFQQEVLTALTQSYEDARIREVRDTPAISVFESPRVSAVPNPRGRIKSTLLGGMVGTFFAAVLILASAALRRRRSFGDGELDEIIALLREFRGEIARLGRRSVRKPA